MHTKMRTKDKSRGGFLYNINQPVINKDGDTDAPRQLTFLGLAAATTHRLINFCHLGVNHLPSPPKGCLQLHNVLNHAPTLKVDYQQLT